MRPIVFGILFLTSTFLSGCMAVDSSVGQTVNRLSGSKSQRPRTPDVDFDLLDRVDEDGRLARLPVDHQLLRELAADTPRGSQVRIADESDLRYFIGTLLHVTDEQVELMNCVCREPVPTPDGRKQCKTSHVPFQSFKAQSLTHFTVLAPPASDFPSPESELDTSEVCVTGLVFRSGRHQRWGQPPKHSATDE